MEVGHLTLAWQYVAIIINYSLFLHITHHEPFLCHHLQEPVSSPSILHAHNNLSFTEPMLIILLMCEEDNTLSATTTRLVNTNCKRILTTCWNNYCNHCLSSGGVCYLALVPSCCASSSTEEQEIRKFPVPSASDGRHYCDANFYCVIGQLAMEEEELWNWNTRKPNMLICPWLSPVTDPHPVIWTDNWSTIPISRIEDRRSSRPNRHRRPRMAMTTPLLLCSSILKFSCSSNTRDTPCANDLAPQMSSLVPWPLPLSSLWLLELDRSQKLGGWGECISVLFYVPNPCILGTRPVLPCKNGSCCKLELVRTKSVFVLPYSC